MEFSELSELEDIIALVSQLHQGQYDPLQILQDQSRGFQDLLGSFDAADYDRMELVTRSNGPEAATASRQEENEQAASKPRSTETHDFEPQDPKNCTSVFTRCHPVGQGRAKPEVSALSKLLGNKVSGESGPQLAVANEGEEGFKVTLWMLGTKTKLTLKMLRNATVDETIQAAIQTYKVNNPDINKNSLAYEMRTVEADGMADFDFPPLDRNRAISSFGDNAFAVLADKTYVEAAVGAPAMTSQLSKEEMLNLKSGGSKQYFKVWLPAHRGVVTLGVSPTRSVEHLLNMVCKKRNLNPDYHQLELYTIPGADTQGVSNLIDRSLEVRKIKTTELNLNHFNFADRGVVPGQVEVVEEPKQSPALQKVVEVVRSKSWRNLEQSTGESKTPKPDDADKSKKGPRVPFNFMTAGQYCEYDVTKINKHKTRERRVMGIDQDRIHNKLPTGPQTQAGLFGGFMKSMQAGKKTKKGYKEIRHVVEITHKAGTNVFVIKYNEGDGVDAYEFEAISEDIAAEIVEKVKYLMDQVPK